MILADTLQTLIILLTIFCNIFLIFSPVQATKQTAVRHEIAIFSEFLKTSRENLTSNEVSQNVKHELQKVLAWFIIDYFTHKLI